MPLKNGDIVWVPSILIGDVNEFIRNSIPLLDYMFYRREIPGCAHRVPTHKSMRSFDQYDMTQYDLNLREYWRIIKKRRWIILFTLILTGSFSTLFALLNKPVPLYKSTASVKLERIMLSGGGIYQEAMPWTNPDLLTAQAAMIAEPPDRRSGGEKIGAHPGESHLRGGQGRTRDTWRRF